MAIKIVLATNGLEEFPHLDWHPMSEWDQDVPAEDYDYFAMVDLFGISDSPVAVLTNGR